MKRLISTTLIFQVFLTLCLSCKQKQTTVVAPEKDALTILIEGNQRFLTNHPIHPDQTLERLRALEKGQHPFAVVVTCSDSRVTPELIFDQGLGDLFVIRNAGNIIDDYEIGSVEYAVEHLQTPLVIVLGHTNCGAIGAYLEHQHDSIPNHIQSIVDYIKQEPEELILDKNSREYYEAAIKANVQHGVSILQQSEPVMQELIDKKEVTVLGAIYDLHTGKVNWIENHE